LSDNNRAFLRIVQKFGVLNGGPPTEELHNLFNYENKISGLTLLTRLVLSHKFKTAKMLFNSQVNVNYQHSGDGETVLHKTIRSGDKKAIGFAIYI
jgi:hypothetical protein